MGAFGGSEGLSDRFERGLVTGEEGSRSRGLKRLVVFGCERQGMSYDPGKGEEKTNLLEALVNSKQALGSCSPSARERP